MGRVAFAELLPACVCFSFCARGHSTPPEYRTERGTPGRGPGPKTLRAEAGEVLVSEGMPTSVTRTCVFPWSVLIVVSVE